MKIFLVLLLFIATVECGGSRKPSAMNDDIYAIIVKLIEGSFDVPCAKRSTVEKTAITRFYRNRGRYSLRGHPPELFLDEKRVLRKSELHKVVSDAYFKAKGSGARRLNHKLRDSLSGLSERLIQNVLSGSRSHGLVNVRFTNKASYIPVVAKQVMERLQIDLINMNPGLKNKNKFYNYILIVIDIFSKYIWLRPLQSKSCYNVVHQLSKIFDIFGPPKFVQYDQGAEFHSQVKRVLTNLGIQYVNSVPYDPQIQGNVEWSHRSLKSKIYFDLFTKGPGFNWVRELPKYEKKMNDEPQEVLGWMSPFNVFFHRHRNELKNVKWKEANELPTCKIRENAYRASKNFYFTLDQQARLEHLETDHGLSVRYNPLGDGNCQFSAVTDQLETIGIYRHHETLRTEVVRFLQRQTSSWSSFIAESPENYLTRMVQDGTYGDQITLQAISDMLHVQILIVSSLNQGTTLITPNGRMDDSFSFEIPYIILGHLAEGSGEHFVSLRNDRSQVISIIRNSAQIYFEDDICPDEGNVDAATTTASCDDVKSLRDDDINSVRENDDNLNPFRGERADGGWITTDRNIFPFDRLPFELLIRIVEYAISRDISSRQFLSCVNRRFKAAVDHAWRSARDLHIYVNPSTKTTTGLVLPKFEYADEDWW